MKKFIVLALVIGMLSMSASSFAGEFGATVEDLRASIIKCDTINKNGPGKDYASVSTCRDFGVTIYMFTVISSIMSGVWFSVVTNGYTLKTSNGTRICMPDSTEYNQEKMTAMFMRYLLKNDKVLSGKFEKSLISVPAVLAFQDQFPCR